MEEWIVGLCPVLEMCEFFVEFWDFVIEVEIDLEVVGISHDF